MGRLKNNTARLAVKALRNAVPTMRAEDIAVSLQISAVTVRNIINELGLPHLHTGRKRGTHNKPDTRWRGDTATQVINIRKANPCAMLQDIADKVGVTRERVRQILKRENLPTRHYVQRQLYECLNCGKPTQHRKYCSPKCSYEYTHPLVECDNCHKLFRCPTLRIARNNPKNPLAKHNHLFCSKKCQGQFCGTHYGFVTHPENAQPKHIRKYNYELVAQQAIELHKQGLTGNDIARQLNIKQSYFWRILQVTHTQFGSRNKSQSTPQKNTPQKTTRFATQHIRVRWLKHLNFTDREIIRMTGCGKSTLYRAIYLRQGRKRVTV